MKTFVAKSGRLLGLAAAALLAQAAPALGAAQPISPVGQWDCVMNGSGQNGILFLNFTSDLDPITGLPTFEGIIAQAGHKGFKSSASGRTGNIGNQPRAGSSSAGVTNIFGGGFINGAAGEVADNGGPGDWLADSRGHRGTWFFNSKGQVVGSFYMVLNATGVVTNFEEMCIDEVLQIPLTNGGVFNQQVQFCFTNPVFATNILWGPAGDGEVGVTNLVFTNNNFFVGTLGFNQNISFVGKVSPN